MEKIKRYVFRKVRVIPYVQNKLAEEKSKIKTTIEHDMNKFTDGLDVYSKLPFDSKSADEVLEEAQRYLNLGQCFLFVVAKKRPTKLSV